MVAPKFFARVRKTDEITVLLVFNVTIPAIKSLQALSTIAVFVRVKSENKS
ncbi:unnamed protein product [Ceratitis capitata]|uniref:(Mediterranean fruit fly) hypothetical protein n=1 Tax=Ceratitis capitata TaxID=7213 RepID=A0A811VED8_CERCA|nr:unnamed protein product [Ceratitis capitata]